MWSAIQRILPFNIAKLGLGQVLVFSKIRDQWDNALSNLFGSVFAGKAKPIALERKVLTVDCLNSAWASELQIKQEKIISELNRIGGQNTVEKIRFIS